MTKFTKSQTIAIIGTGFVADLYMNSLRSTNNITVAIAYDINKGRLLQFCSFWNVQAASSIANLFENFPKAGLILNLTNPNSHYEISHACLLAGYNVYSEKPLATDLTDAKELIKLADALGLQIASAPCSVLGEAAQTTWKAIRDKILTGPRLTYAELDDGFIPLAPYDSWVSETGAPWPHEDEFRTGCTLEHAGYYLTWLMAMFGRVRTVSAASATLVGDLHATKAPAPDFSVAVLFFDSGMVARLTCSIIAPHDHSLRIIGENGTLELEQAWNNSATVRMRRRIRIRRRLMDSPLTRRISINGPTHPKVGRKGSASMNFALGPAEMLQAIATDRPARLGGEFALHLTEVTLAIQNSRENSSSISIESDCPQINPMEWAL